MARLITRNELIERFDLPIGGTGWVEKQRSFLKQAATACLSASTQSQSRDALVQLLGSIVNDQDDGFDAYLVEESASLLRIIQPPVLTMCDSVKQPLEAAMHSTANTDNISNLLVRFPMHGSVFLQSAEARLKEIDDALMWFERASNIRERLAPKATSDLLEDIGSAREAFDAYVLKPEYRELLKASMPGDEADYEATTLKVLERLYQRALAKWSAFVQAFASDQPALYLLTEGDQGKAHALSEACASLPLFGSPEIDALVAKFGMISKWLACMKSGVLASVFQDAEVPIDELWGMQILSEGVRELVADLPEEEANVVQEFGLIALASRLATRLLKQVEEPMKKLAKVHATSKGLVAVYSDLHNTEEDVANAIASVLLAAKEVGGIDEDLAKTLAGNINLQRSQFLLRHGKLGAAAAKLLEPSWPECAHTIAYRHDAACGMVLCSCVCTSMAKSVQVVVWVPVVALLGGCVSLTHLASRELRPRPRPSVTPGFSLP